MVKIFGPFGQGAGKSWRTSEWSKQMSKIMSDGFFGNYLNAMQAYADSTGMQVKIKTGSAWLRGHYYENDTEEILAVTAAHATLTRWDMVVLEVDWTKTDNQIITKVVAGTPAASPTLPTLVQTATVWQVALAKIVVGASVVTIAETNVTDLRTFSSPGNGVGSGTIFNAINNSAINLAQGMCIINDSASSSVTTTNIQGDPSILGIVLGAVGVRSVGQYATAGVQFVLVLGNVAQNHWLIPSTTPGYAMDSGSTQRPTAGAIGFARTAFIGTSGLVETMVSIVPASTTNFISQLATITSASGSGASASLTINHTVDAGTDMTIVLLFAHGNNVPTFSSCIAGTTGMTLIGSITNGYYACAAYRVRGLAAGAVSIVATGAEWYNNISGVAFNVSGSQSSPIRNYVFDTAQSHSHASIAGDLIIDFLSVTGVESAISSQTIFASSTPDNHLYSAKLAVTTSGSITVAWSGPTTALVHGSFVIAAS